ncbi:MAG TPA: nicotinate phosphoribosyltransferase, partial [Pedococcus sp.]
DAHDVAAAEVIGVGEPPEGDSNDRPLLVQLVEDGEVVGRQPLDVARLRHERSRDELPVLARTLQKGDPVIPTLHVGAS